jgi:hypothetical protein
MDSTKSTSGHMMQNMCFCIRCDLWVPGHEMLTHYFSCSVGPGVVSVKSALGHMMSNFYFCIQCDLWVRKCISVHLGCKTSTHYFYCSGVPGTDSIKRVPGHVMPNMCFLHTLAFVGHVMHVRASGS